MAVRRRQGIAQPLEVRVAVIGNVDSGKSTVVGVLTRRFPPLAACQVPHSGSTTGDHPLPPQVCRCQQTTATLGASAKAF